MDAIVLADGSGIGRYSIKAQVCAFCVHIHDAQTDEVLHKIQMSHISAYFIRDGEYLALSSYRHLAHRFVQRKYRQASVRILSLSNLHTSPCVLCTIFG